MVEPGILENIDAFKGMDPAQQERLRSRAEMISYERGNKLFSEGDIATHFWVVVDGQVDLRFELPGRETSEEHNVSSVETREKAPESKYLGWSCFVPPHRMRLSAYCVSDSCSILRVSKEDLLNMFEEDPKMGYSFMTFLVTVVGFRFHQFQNEVAKNIGEDLLAGW